jgi:hypothetical protein
MPLKRTTALQDMADTLDELGPAGGEDIIEYSVFLSDAFGRNPSVASGRTNLHYFDGPGVPQQIDGFSNDDSYRRSTHLLNGTQRRAQAANAAPGAIIGAGDAFRENSLARQLQSKRDQPAVIRLLKRVKPGEKNPETGVEFGRPWVSIIPPSTKFFLEQVTENREEKVQVLDTFGEFIAFFFGARPEVYTYSGTLLNSLNHDWKNEFQLNYEHFMRGSKAVENRATMFLQYDDVIVEGYMMNSQIRQTAIEDMTVPFTFNLLVLNRSPLNPRNILVTRSLRQQLTVFEQALLTSLNESLQLTEGQAVEDVQTFLLMREWLNGSGFPSAGKAVHRTGTNNIAPERTKPNVAEDSPLDPNSGYLNLNTAEDPTVVPDTGTETAFS